MKDLLLITNADAGSNDEHAVETALQVLRTGATVQVAATSDQDDLADALRSLGERDVVVAGGDGSLHAVVAQLHRDGVAGPTVGLIPLGTGNDFARGVGIPLEPADAAGVVLSGRLRTIDVFVDDEGGLVVNAVHIGVGADAGREAAPWKSALGKIGLGKLGYAIGGLLAGFKSQGHRVRVVADDTVLAAGDRRVFQVGIGNGSNIGGGTALTPDADPGDGLADVVVSFSVGRLDRLLYGVHLKRGTHEERHDVTAVRARKVEVSGQPFWCNADGELTGPVRRRSWTVRPATFQMLVPAEG